MFDFAAAIRTLNAMMAAGVIRSYAIGGVMAYVIWAEPIATQDLDVAVVVGQPTHALDPLRPVFDWLTANGIALEGEHAIVGGVPVQFLPAWTPLVQEGVENAAEATYQGVTVRVLRPAYLVASWKLDAAAYSSARRERAANLVEQGAVTREEIDALVKRFAS